MVPLILGVGLHNSRQERSTSSMTVRFAATPRLPPAPWLKAAATANAGKHSAIVTGLEPVGGKPCRISGRVLPAEMVMREEPISNSAAWSEDPHKVI